MTDSSEWTGPVGTAWAREWRRTDRSFGALTDRLLDPAAIGGFARALDIGCGAGELVERLAAAHPRARVTGLDISAELLAVARARCAHLPNARFAECDAAQWQAASGEALDLLVSRHGVMFFADPPGAFAHLRAQCAPGATLRFSCFRARADNAWAGALDAALALPPSAAAPDAPGPFAFAERDRVAGILGAAGWTEVAFEPLDYAMIAGEGEGAVEEALSYFQRIGPAARALREMPADGRPAALDRLRGMIAAHHRASQVTMPAAAWIVTARAP
ncbi:MAG: class I SAM-dependent methyltransferase [Qipengyuania sp.]|nr:class I SAM-dependent methyltransferase [Qipengyuania sp.]